ncbi:MAG: carboxylating nicotinate-nucleotide diphosphorylase [Thioalkalispiraceae bacterium]|jgi:nicotinate-nucleotide pyrophosphorylase (carboxylating)
MHIDDKAIETSVRLAIAEDVGSGDVTAHLIDVDHKSNAKVITREAGVICGQAWFDETFKQLEPNIEINWNIGDGACVVPKQTLCTVSGNTRAMLTAERTALNFLQTLSGTATITKSYVDALAGTGVQILDTRKTLPGLRLAQKYAVHCGGGMNHRIGLFDMILIKENHIVGCGSIQSAMEKAQAVNKNIEIEIEVRDLDELQQALDAGARRILLDNFSIEDLKQAVRQNQQQAKLEVSGNVTLENIRNYALTGIDYISSGSITKHVRALDLSMQFV